MCIIYNMSLVNNPGLMRRRSVQVPVRVRVNHLQPAETKPHKFDPKAEPKLSREAGDFACIIIFTQRSGDLVHRLATRGIFRFARLKIHGQAVLCANSRRRRA